MPRKIRNHSTAYSNFNNNKVISDNDLITNKEEIWQEICSRTEDHSRRLYLWDHYQYSLLKQKNKPRPQPVPETIFKPNALDANTCQEYISLFQTHGGHGVGKIGHGVEVDDTRKADVWSFENDYVIRQFRDIIWSANNEHWRYQLSDIEAPQLCVYYHTSKGHYTWHRDCEDPNIEPIGRRIISMSILMNDPSEFEGGNLEILRGIQPNGMPMIDTVPFENAGDACVFQSRLYHRVTPVTKGTRASMVVWCWGNDARAYSKKSLESAIGLTSK